MHTAINILLLLLALLWTLLITALIGNVIASNINGSEGAINFTMFVAALSWVTCLIGLASSFVNGLARPMLLIPLYALTALFALINGIVLAAELKAINCSHIARHHLSHNWIGFGSRHNERRCREIQASTAFLWFLWTCLTAVLVLAFLARKNFGGSTVSSSRPSMSQIGV